MNSANVPPGRNWLWRVAVEWGMEPRDPDDENPEKELFSLIAASKAAAESAVESTVRARCSIGCDPGSRPIWVEVVSCTRGPLPGWLDNEDT